MVLYFTTALALAFLIGCGHTNRLSEYPILNATALYTTRVSPKALGTDVWLAPLPPDTTRPLTVDWVLEIARIGGEILTEAEASRKLQEALVPEELAAAAGRGFQAAAESYLRLAPLRSLEQEPPFVVETVLEEYTLTSSAFGIRAHVAVRSRILHRPSAQVVWEKSEKTTIPLQRTTAAGFIPGAATAASVFNAVRLLSLPTDELRRVLEYAAQRAGEELGESLRQDVAKLPRKGI